mgnify:CR=1 FL=1
MLDWLAKNSSILLFLAAIIGWVWTTAMQYQRMKQTQTDVEGLKLRVMGHVENGKIHIDPERDGRRMVQVEEDLVDVNKKLDDIMKLLVEIRLSTKGLKGNS